MTGVERDRAQPSFDLDVDSRSAAAFEPVFATSAGDAESGDDADVGDGVRRVYLDLPGTGGSAAVGPTSDAVLDVVAEAIGDLAGAAAYLLAGHSYGGYLACGLVRRDPTWVAGLLLVNSGVRIDPGSRDLSGVQPSYPEPGWPAALPASLSEHLNHAVGRQTSDVAQRLADAFALVGDQDEAYLATLRRHGYRLSDEDTPFAYGGPASVLAGRRDRIVGYRDSFRLIESLPDANYTVLSDAGHYLPFERPRAFARLVAQWLTRAAPASGLPGGPVP